MRRTRRRRQCTHLDLLTHPPTHSLAHPHTHTHTPLIHTHTHSHPLISLSYDRSYMVCDLVSLTLRSWRDATADLMLVLLRRRVRRAVPVPSLLRPLAAAAVAAVAAAFAAAAAFRTEVCTASALRRSTSCVSLSIIRSCCDRSRGSWSSSLADGRLAGSPTTSRARRFWKGCENRSSGSLGV